MTRQEELERRERRNPRRCEDESRREEQRDARDVKFRPAVPPGRGRYDNQPSENQVPVIGLLCYQVRIGTDHQP